MKNDQKIRCGWAKNDEREIAYHDNEWGVPTFDDNRLFEFFILESAQAGLSWSTILRKREAYREAYYQFDINKVCSINQREVEKLLTNSGIVRNRLKINASISNALIFRAIQKEFGSFSNYLWSFVNNKVIQNKWQSLSNIPAVSKESTALSDDLRKRGCKFFGPTIAYAYMQAIGMINDHVTECFCYKKLRKCRPNHRSGK